MTKKCRLDVKTQELGLAESRSLAQKLILAGKVRVNGQVVTNCAARVADEDLIEALEGPRFVSRGGDKLAPALNSFGLIDLQGWICADVGASTGGFTDCLLQYGAARVYAIDVGYGLLHWKLRSDPRVVVMERTNARYVDSLPETPNLVTIDASFISLKLLLPVVRGWLDGKLGQVVALVKPQFEAGKEAADQGGGVIRDKALRRQVLADVLGFASAHGFVVAGLEPAVIQGPKGNQEYLVHLALEGSAMQPADIRILLDHALR